MNLPLRKESDSKLKVPQASSEAKILRFPSRPKEAKTENPAEASPVVPEKRTKEKLRLHLRTVSRNEVLILITAQCSIGILFITVVLSLFSHASSTGVVLTAVLLNVLSWAFRLRHKASENENSTHSITHKTWQQNELLFFIDYSVLTVVYGLLIYLGSAGLLPHRIGTPLFVNTIGIATAAAGITALYCSTRLYASTGRPTWVFKTTLFKFFLSASILGSAWVAGFSKDYAFWGCLAILVVASSIKFKTELSLICSKCSKWNKHLRISAQLMTQQMPRITWTRLSLLAVAGVALPLILVINQWELQSVIFVLFGLLAFAELCERYQFFACVSTTRKSRKP